MVRTCATQENIADLPTKLRPIPFPAKLTKNFTCLKQCYELILNATKAIETGTPVDPLCAL